MSKPSRRKWDDITDMLTPQGIEALKAGKDIGLSVGQVMRFDYEGSETSVKIMRLDRTTGKMWGKEIELYTADEVPSMELED